MAVKSPEDRVLVWTVNMITWWGGGGATYRGAKPHEHRKRRASRSGAAAASGSRAKGKAKGKGKARAKGKGGRNGDVSCCGWCGAELHFLSFVCFRDETGEDRRVLTRFLRRRAGRGFRL